ncbi:MAG TPA: nicotinate-nucleotide--dimethylbenzimidazole phosphoribosyltransferase [Lachnospiraceae bacterium]
METLLREIKKIKGLDKEAMADCQRRWNQIAKPLHSLGKIEDMLVAIAGITKETDISLEKKALVVMCADNGVVSEGVTQTGKEVTAIVAENFKRGNTCTSLMSKRAGVDVFPVDIGIARDTNIINKKVMYGSNNLAREDAMPMEKTIEAIKVGISMVLELKEQGYKIIGTGEMGIGNTTSSSALAAALLGRSAKEVTGRGAGLDKEGLKRKVKVIEKALDLHQPKMEAPLSVLSQLGGLDIAGMVGLFLGGAIYRLPIVIDGFISAVSALVAVRICPRAADFMLASHFSKEPGFVMVMEEIKKSPCIYGDLSLGEGSGAVALMPLLDMGVDIYRQMSTFGENAIKDYEELV